MVTPEEMATEVVKAWISGKSTGAKYLTSEMKEIYLGMIDAYKEAQERKIE